MKSPVQRLLWQRKLELLERRPAPAPEPVKPPRMTLLARLALAFGLRTANQLRKLGHMQ